MHDITRGFRGNAKSQGQYAVVTWHSDLVLCIVSYYVCTELLILQPVMGKESILSFEVGHLLLHLSHGDDWGVYLPYAGLYQYFMVYDLFKCKKIDLLTFDRLLTVASF